MIKGVTMINILSKLLGAAGTAYIIKNLSDDVIVMQRNSVQEQRLAVQQAKQNIELNPTKNDIQHEAVLRSHQRQLDKEAHYLKQHELFRQKTAGVASKVEQSISQYIYKR